MTPPVGKVRRIEIDACLDDMRRAAEAIERYTRGVSRQQFLGNEEKQDAVIRRIEVIGEAADRLMKAAPEYQANFPDLPLRDIKDMRNLLVHGYDAIDAGIVWETAQPDVPALRVQLDKAIAARDTH